MSKESFKLINELSFVVFDLETTGGNHKNDKIIEIGLVKIENLKITDQKSFLIRPEISIPKFIQKLTNIAPKDLKGAPIIEDVIDEILKFMGDSILVAHNTSFDIPFFNSVLTRLNRPILTNKSLCTNLMTKYLIPGIMNTNLNHMCKVFEIGHERAHRALDDAFATAKLLLIFLDSFVKRDIKKINHLYYPKNRFELGRLNFKAHSKEEREAIRAEIINKIISLKTSAIITLKGENGIIQFSIISKGSPNEIKFLTKKIKKYDWKIVTIKLVGGLIDGHIDFIPLFNKLEKDERIDVLQFLWKEYIGTNIDKPKNGQEKEASNFLGDFVISNHLVTDQYTIYPMNAISKKHKLVFRYPTHSKKLFQYLKSKKQKLAGTENQEKHCHLSIENFIFFYLKKCKEENSNVFFLDYKDYEVNSTLFLEKLEKFLAKYSNTYHYPKEHI